MNENLIYGFVYPVFTKFISSNTGVLLLLLVVLLLL